MHLLFMHALQGIVVGVQGLESVFLPLDVIQREGASVRPHLEVFHERFFAAASRGFEAGRTRSMSPLQLEVRQRNA